jgi:hypothetical protein
MTGYVAIRRRLGVTQFHHHRDTNPDRQCNTPNQDTADDGTRGEDFGASTGERLSSLWLCAGSWEMINWPLEDRHRRTGSVAGTKRKLKDESQGMRPQERIVESAWAPIVPPRRWRRCATMSSALLLRAGGK